jgi:hypothetical protein
MGMAPARSMARLRTGRRRRARFRKCAGCGEQFDDAAWVGLAMSERIEANELRRLVLKWPEGLCIEVRYCDRCGTLIAKKCGAGSVGSAR